jgi:hypothetical protein
MYHFINKNTEVVPNNCKEPGLEVNIENPKFMCRSCYLNSEQKHDIKTANKSLEYAKFQYLGGIKQRCIREDIKSILNSGKAS